MKLKHPEYNGIMISKVSGDIETKSTGSIEYSNENKWKNIKKWNFINFFVKCVNIFW